VNLVPSEGKTPPAPEELKVMLHNEDKSLIIEQAGVDSSWLYHSDILFKNFKLPAGTYYASVAKTNGWGADPLPFVVGAAAGSNQVDIKVEYGKGPKPMDVTLINTLRASIVNNQVVLDWVPVNGATAYNIYRGKSPYFTADDTTKAASNVVPAAFPPDRVEWIDNTFAPGESNGVNDSALNYFYTVSAMINNQESAISNRVGEYTYSLQKFPPTDYVWVAYLLDTNYSRTPATTLSALGKTISNLSPGYPQYFDIDTQQTLPNDHALAIGEAIQIKLTGSGNLQFAGGVAKTSFNIKPSNPTNYNWISLPLDHDATTLDNLKTEIGVVNSGYPQYFDVPSQQPLSKTDEIIYGGKPLQLKVTGSTTWPTE
jgi:hypothetical protein